MPPRSIVFCISVIVTLVVCRPGGGHEPSRHAFERALALAQAEADAAADDFDPTRPDAETCRLTIDLVDEFSRQSVAGLVRVTNVESGKAVKLTGHFHRALNWYSLGGKTTVRVPRTKVRIEAVRGLETVRAERVVDLSSSDEIAVQLTLGKFYDSSFRDWHSGNTHLHLMKMTRDEADRYLQVVPRSDNLGLVFLSYLRRIPDEKDYISNRIVEDRLAETATEPDEKTGLLLANCEELRHNFGRGGEGYGHVMLLDLQKLIRPVSLGPGIMGSGTDGLPLQPKIREARGAGATVVWCHNAFGYEDIPNWLSGLVHAQNIFDGGSRGSYEDTFYRYLNVGLRVPFSTGTDWFMYDFARVYVPVFGPFSTDKWLQNLRDGKSYITNGPLLELETERASLGETIDFFGPNRVTVVGRGLGRLDFGGIELVHNGKVVHRVDAEADDGFFYADLRHSLEVNEPGWFALRIPADAGKNELGRPLFAHTSPVYIEMEGRRNIFRKDVARELVDEMRESMAAIQEKGTFADDAEREKVLEVYQAAIRRLEGRIQADGN